MIPSRSAAAEEERLRLRFAEIDDRPRSVNGALAQYRQQIEGPLRAFAMGHVRRESAVVAVHCDRRVGASSDFVATAATDRVQRAHDDRPLRCAPRIARERATHGERGRETRTARPACTGTKRNTTTALVR